eukprot:gb/GECH01005046.1/.p1 GENE.gb/GECH01005046.1/~~gb/GECH01005046.1/.p1  ORF type:complete len:840 (+),score=206.76 gb/GECH01005046.1/:1-2520(+)
MNLQSVLRSLQEQQQQNQTSSNEEESYNDNDGRVRFTPTEINSDAEEEDFFVLENESPSILTEELGKMMHEKLGYQPSVSTLNPAMPLRFETYVTLTQYQLKNQQPTQTQNNNDNIENNHDNSARNFLNLMEREDSSLKTKMNQALEDHKNNPFQFNTVGFINGEYNLLESVPEIYNMFKTQDHFKAHCKCIKSYCYLTSNMDESQIQKVSEKAHKALDMCNQECSEAHSLLALCVANNYEEALEYYMKGVEVGPLALKDQKDFDEAFEDGDVFGPHPLRGYFRCLHGVANTYRKMGRYQESAEWYAKLESADHTRLDSKRSWGSYCQWRYHYPEVLIGAGKYNEAIEYMNKYKNNFEYSSTGTCWRWCRALCDYIKGKKSWCHEFYQVRGRRTIPAFMEKGAAINLSLQTGVFVLHYLTGKLRLPKIKFTSILNGAVQGTDAIHCLAHAASVVPLWHRFPGAVEWALKNFNTMIAIGVISKNRQMLKLLQMEEVKKPKQMRQLFRTIFNSKTGFWADAISDGNGQTLLHQAVTCSRLEPLYTIGLLKRQATLRTQFEPTPFHMAFYYDAHPAIQEALLDYGADPMYGGNPSKMGRKFPPLLMASNQGNWIGLDTIFRLKPHLCKRKYFEQVLDNLFSTSVYECIKGGSKCERCINDNVSHSENVNFELCIDVIFKYGFTINPINIQNASIPGFESLHRHLCQRAEQMARHKIKPKELAPLPDKMVESLRHYYRSENKRWDPRIASSNHSKVKRKTKTRNSTSTKSKSSDFTSKNDKSISRNSNQESNEQKKCAHCGRTNAKEGTKLKRCSACKSVYYCSRNCQIIDWNSGHKEKCKGL